MAHGIDPSLHRMKATANNASVNHPFAHPHRQQLPPRNEPALTLGQLRDPAVPRLRCRFPTCEVVNCGFARHALESDSEMRTRGAHRVAEASRATDVFRKPHEKRLQPAVAASSFDPFK